MIYVQIRPKGTRLGNWMFQYAAAKSAYPDDDITFVIEDRNDWVKVEKYKILFPNVQITAQAANNAVLRTELYQDARFISPEIAGGLFQCPEEIKKSITNKYGSILQNDKLISIHVRRGDYLQLPHRHPFVGKTYLKRAIARFAEKSNVEFIVCSDDIVWCKKFFVENRFKGVKFHFSEGNSVLEDLFLMRMCKGGHICSNSTFSWWGAYCSATHQPLTIFPSMWYGPAVHEDWQGLYFNGAEIIENHYTAMTKLSAYAHMAKEAVGKLLRKTGMR